MKYLDTIFLRVLTPEKILWEGRVGKVELPGSKGPFMVLKDHAPLISSLAEGRIAFTSAGVDECVDIRSGFVEIAYNDVIVCVEL